MLNKADMLAADLLIVMGTSLQVQPFCGMPPSPSLKAVGLVNKVRENCPRLLINKEAVGPFRFYTMDCCYRDVVYLGDCDEGVKELCKELGWLDELEDLYTKGRTKLEKIRQKYLASKEEALKQREEQETNKKTEVEANSETLSAEPEGAVRSTRLRNSSASSVSSDMLLETDDEDSDYGSNSMKSLTSSLSAIGRVHSVRIEETSQSVVAN